MCLVDLQQALFGPKKTLLHRKPGRWWLWLDRGSQIINGDGQAPQLYHLARNTTHEMVNLSITSSMVEAITYGVTNKVENWPFPQDEERWSAEKLAVGQPISHDEVIALSRCLKTHVNSKTKSVSNKQDQVVHFGLDDLLRGSRVYVEPPKPKPKPVSLVLICLRAFLTNSYRHWNTRL